MITSSNSCRRLVLFLVSYGVDIPGDEDMFGMQHKAMVCCHCILRLITGEQFCSGSCRAYSGYVRNVECSIRISQIHG